jgi:SWI/SNF-related matrix-associated actin-dependent regulator 1 of chromatin subfamily A
MTSLLNFINPEIFNGCMQHIQYIFSQKVTIRDVSNGAFLYSERVKRARTILEPFILQRRKDQVLSDMPPKICSVVRCELDKNQKEVYAEYEEMFKMEPSKRVTKVRGRGNDQNNCWMQLRKAALHPLLFRRHFDDKKIEKMARILMDSVSQEDLRQPDIKHLIQELKDSSDFGLHLWCRDYPGLLSKFDYPPETEMDSGKVRKLLELINQYQENGDRVLVFSKFSRVIELLQEVLAQQGIQHRVLMGSTTVGERQMLIDEFNDDPEIPVFLLTTGAGGTGINLTAANKVVIFDQSDNPQDDIQAENRAHRLGQKRDVEIIRLIASNTIEELIYKACQKKIELANKVTGAVADEDPVMAEQTLETEVRKMLMEEQMTPP